MNRTMSLALLCLITVSASAAQSPLIEAEATSTGTVLADAQASGRSATTASEAWHPLLKVAPPPAALGDQVLLWVRHRGGPLQLKSLTADGEQRELQWVWDKPAEWTWSSFGPNDRTLFVNGAIVIRGGEGDAPAIDVAGWTRVGAPAPTLPTAR